MLELSILLTVGYLGGCFLRTAWIFLSSVFVLVASPVYLVEEMGIGSPVALICLTLIAIAAVQSGSLTALLKAQAEPK